MGVEIVARRHRPGAGEWMVGVEEAPAAAHDHEQALEVSVGCCLVQLKPSQVALPPEDVVQKAASLDKLLDHLVLSFRERVRVEGHVDAFPFGEAFGKLISGLR